MVSRPEKTKPTLCQGYQVMLQRRDGPRFFLWNAFVGILGVLIGRWSDRPALAPVCPRPAADTTLPATPLLSAVEAQGEHGGKRSLLVVARPLRNILLDNEGKLMLAAKRVAIDVGTSVKAPTSRHFLCSAGADAGDPTGRIGTRGKETPCYE